MKLYLVQHGEAEEADVDPQRRLTDKGRRDVETVAAFLKPLGLAVNAIWHSGKPRAQQTAEVLLEAIVADEGMLRRDGLSPNDEVAPVADEIGERTSDLMVVGHMPFLGRLASLLLTGNEDAGPVAYQRGGVVCLEGGEGRPWQVRWILVPELPE